MFAGGEKVPFSRRKKLIISFAVTLVAVLVGTGVIGYFSVANKLSQILPGSPLDAITKNEPLQSDSGRTNVIIFGTSYDDPNPRHTGGYLTDSLIVLSINKATKTAYTMSIPRDLWVSYDTSCNLGKSGKINAAYLCARNAYGNDEDKASRALADKVSSITGMPIHYYLEVNYTFIQSLTDALGGIDVDTYSSDPRGIYDPAVGLKLPAGVNHLDGKTALKLARARNSQGGYGLPRSNFDREINQQRIVAAIFKKASQQGTLNDVGGALKMIDALSGQVRTNVQTSELRDAVNTARKLDASSIVSVPLTGHMTTGSMNGQSIVRPTAGVSDYSALQAYIAEKAQAGNTP